MKKDVIICKQHNAGLQLGFVNTANQQRMNEGEANARLIATAPELLYTIQQARGYVKQAAASNGHAFGTLQLIDNVLNKVLE